MNLLLSRTHRVILSNVTTSINLGEPVKSPWQSPQNRQHLKSPSPPLLPTTSPQRPDPARLKRIQPRGLSSQQATTLPISSRSLLNLLVRKRKSTSLSFLLSQPKKNHHHRHHNNNNLSQATTVVPQSPPLLLPRFRLTRRFRQMPMRPMPHRQSRCKRCRSSLLRRPSLLRFCQYR